VKEHVPVVLVHYSEVRVETQESRWGMMVKEIDGYLTDVEKVMVATHCQDAKERYRMPVAVIGAQRMSDETARYSFRLDRVHSGVEMARNSEVGSPPIGAEAAGCIVSGSWAAVQEVEGIVDLNQNFLLEAIGCMAGSEVSTDSLKNHMDLSGHL
jgi:hypothetical protein